MHRKLVERIAANQHGVITIGQLYWAGLTPDAVRHQVRRGYLHRIYHGVYAVGRPDLTREGEWMAAVKACGDGAALSHRSAAELWKLLEYGGGLIHVTVPVRGGRAPRDRIRIHRIAALTPELTTLRDRIPVTKPRRTLEDLRGSIEPSLLRDAIRGAEVAHLPIGDLTHLVHGTRSELELMFLELVRRHRLPEPEVNLRVGRFLVDFLWRPQRVIAEVDGERFHRGATATADDLARDAALRGLGFEVVRLGYWEIVNHPRAAVGQLSDRL
jgi:very-short-patch-repair endonuclease